MRTSAKLKRLAIACALSSMLSLGGCATLQTLSAALTKRAPEIDVNAVACGAFKPIHWSDDDTDDTLAQIHEHNSAYVALCGAPS